MQYARANLQSRGLLRHSGVGDNAFCFHKSKKTILPYMTGNTSIIP